MTTLVTAVCMRIHTRVYSICVYVCTCVYIWLIVRYSWSNLLLLMHQPMMYDAHNSPYSTLYHVHCTLYYYLYGDIWRLEVSSTFTSLLLRSTHCITRMPPLVSLPPHLPFPFCTLLILFSVLSFSFTLPSPVANHWNTCTVVQICSCITSTPSISYYIKMFVYI